MICMVFDFLLETSWSLCFISITCCFFLDLWPCFVPYQIVGPALSCVPAISDVTISSNVVSFMFDSPDNHREVEPKLRAQASLVILLLSFSS
jgi:hypothetical protein